MIVLHDHFIEKEIEPVYCTAPGISHLSCRIKRVIAWNSRTQTLTCSTADELKDHPPVDSSVNSIQRAGLQLRPQKCHSPCA